ncbi:hypothetical protein K461DRAFT_222289 [Myriangium duriaei CBS 260.36]|uniref:GPI ethanolamine phosphate transferase 2 C-terminal domain-containing protein n=1 Tax=Myriangium duriaei CBS 260.36 TaxID=1168546 RepID=A0A9P4J3R5_9PEZI|nr:hypothetical protein K461DRAFT_222289 [Myriangium duriaei CBS 260.36]
MSKPESASQGSGSNLEKELRQSNKDRRAWFNVSLGRLAAVFLLFLILQAAGIYLFLGGFLLTRLVLDDKSECASPPITLSDKYSPGSVERGCWHPKTFDKAVVILIDALRYDFTVPFEASSQHPKPLHFHDTLKVLYETAVKNPKNAFLLPFIADPPTTTLQRLKGLTTGTLPTFIDAGSNFAGTAIDEDNIVAQLRSAGKNVVHMGDDTWHSLYPGYFDQELTKPYDSFNVWDLHTLDNGVTQHLFPLLDKSNASRWDVIFGHYLGVDHAGHRYGPNHPAMGSKLLEMNEVMTRIMNSIDDNTLLVVMGDHGMDSKGDHGGESDDEIEAAIWMYSKKPVFGRLSRTNPKPPANAKERPVRQIDLVPTLSLLLGLPIPFNNLGRPIDEAFSSRSGADFANLAKVNRLTAAQIHRYQTKYAELRNLDSSSTAIVDRLWKNGQKVWTDTQQMKFPPKEIWNSAFQTFAEYQKKNLELCRDLWARFDNVGILHGIEVLSITFIFFVLFARGLEGQREELAISLLKNGFGYGAAGGISGFVLHKVFAFSVVNTIVYCFSMSSLLGISAVFYLHRQQIKFTSRSFSSWLSALAVLLLCVGFAANSFTIWEDDILLFFLTTFGVFLTAASLRQEDAVERFLGVSQSAIFVACTRAASLSRLCREEQMPYCKSTYYASATSSTSSWWQLLISFMVSALLPSAIIQVFSRSQNYHGSAIIWVGIALRIGLTLSALYWLLDASDDNSWLPSVSSSTLKSTKMTIAQVVLALSYAAGYSTYIYASPFINVEQRAAAAPKTPQTTTSHRVDPSNPTSDVFTSLAPTPTQPKPQILIYGYANTLGTRYFLLVTIWALPLLLLSKPMGQGALSLEVLSLLAALEALDATNLRSSPLGPVLFALLGQFHFFKTGHQAALASIQWESAFVPLRGIVYPWSPLLVVTNTYAGPILAAVAVPAIALWKVPPRTPAKQVLEHVARDVATFSAVYAAFAMATVVEAAWLRRHLMLYRIFMPRMLLAVTSLLTVEVVVLVVGLVGLRWAVVSVGEVFGWG